MEGRQYRRYSADVIRRFSRGIWAVPDNLRDAQLPTRKWNRESIMIFADFNEMPAQESNESSRRSSMSMEGSSHTAFYNEKVLPEPPYHVFSQKRKKQLVYIVSLAGLFSPLSSNIYFPALGQIADVSLHPT